MVGQGRDPVLGQEGGGLLDRLARQAVDDAGVAGVLGAQQVEQLRPRVVLGDDAVLDVRPVEARHEPAGLGQLEPDRDLLGGGRGRRRGQRDPRDGRPPLAEDRELQVVGPEVVAPRGDAVRLVDREQRDASAVEQLQRRGHREPLGREVEQVELAGDVRGLDGAALLGRLRGVQERRAHAQRAHRVDLVLHERDERRDDDAGALPHQGRDLVAQRLAGSGGHQHERVAAGHDRVDDGGLVAAERGVPEHALERLERTGGGAGHVLHGAGRVPPPR